MSAEWVTAIATAGTFIVIAASAIAALMQLGHLRSSNQIAALNECRETIQSAEFQAAERFVSVELSRRLEDPQVQLAMLGRYFPPEFECVRTIANFFENMGVFVKNGIIDRRIACDLWNQVILRNWSALAPVIANRRIALDFPPMWENFEYLAALCQQWEERYQDGTYPNGAPRMQMPALWPLTQERVGANAER
ncbi:MAG TPA: DUF4760 domain-containing protein [Candidatus Baltobacteraceae bacterium]|nr:DUF4760 domain-containing protein [Candidatus Baltobacteraceae bacterium]